jgi:hypothetical protein
MTDTNSAPLPASVGLPGWTIAGVQLVNPDAGTADFAPSVVCQLRVDAGHGADIERVAAADLEKVKALAGTVVHGQRTVAGAAGDVNVREIDVEASAGEHTLRQLMWFFALQGHVYTAVASSQPGAFGKLRPELEKGLKAAVSLMRGTAK